MQFPMRPVGVSGNLVPFREGGCRRTCAALAANEHRPDEEKQFSRAPLDGHSQVRKERDSDVQVLLYAPLRKTDPGSGCSH